MRFLCKLSLLLALFLLFFCIGCRPYHPPIKIADAAYFSSYHILINRFVQKLPSGYCLVSLEHLNGEDGILPIGAITLVDENLKNPKQLWRGTHLYDYPRDFVCSKNRLLFSTPSLSSGTRLTLMNLENGEVLDTLILPPDQILPSFSSFDHQTLPDCLEDLLALDSFSAPAKPELVPEIVNSIIPNDEDEGLYVFLRDLSFAKDDRYYLTFRANRNPKRGFSPFSFPYHGYYVLDFATGKILEKQNIYVEVSSKNAFRFFLNEAGTSFSVTQEGTLICKPKKGPSTAISLVPSAHFSALFAFEAGGDILIGGEEGNQFSLFAKVPVSEAEWRALG